jgi:hypothetical protein
MWWLIERERGGGWRPWARAAGPLGRAALPPRRRLAPARERKFPHIRRPSFGGVSRGWRW